MDSDSRAQSSVIGVALLVAIVVILATVIGSFVLGIADDQPSKSPYMTFTATEQNATFESGCGSSPQVVDVRTVDLAIERFDSSINTEHVNVTVNGYPAYDIDGYGGCQGVDDKIRNPTTTFSVGESWRIVTYATSEPVNNGTEISYDEDASGSRIKTQSIYDGNVAEITPGDTIRVIYSAPESDETSILFKYTV